MSITKATFRVVARPYGSTVFEVRINDAKCGELSVRNEEVADFRSMLAEGGFKDVTRDCTNVR